MAFIGLPRRAKVAAAALMAAALGCGESANVATTKSVTAPDVPVVAREDAGTRSVGAPLAPVVAVSLPVAADEPGNDVTAPTSVDEETAKPPLAEYTPPFPDRVDLFVPPKRQGGVVLKEGGSEDAVELLGFIRLDKQQVVLSINGQLTRIAEGGSQYGIEVISIQPPKVVLQRGRQRWQASLEK